MKINSVVSFAGIKNRTNAQKIAFAREFRDEEEKKDYAASLEKAFEYLGVQNRAMIIHGPSFPDDYENDINRRIGSPYNQKEFLDFLSLHGFNSVQLGPLGELDIEDNSPYISSIFAKNPLFIDFGQLTTPKYGSILSKEDLYLQTYSACGRIGKYTKTNYKEAKEILDDLLDISYKGFLTKLSKGNKKVSKLNEEFLEFQAANAQWLDYFAVLNVIAKKYGTKDYEKWDEQDRNLISEVKKGNPGAISRYEQIKTENNREIDIYKFAQFIVDKQANEDDKKRKVSYIGDLLVGASKFDELVFEDAFLKDWKVGTKAGGPMDSPQIWNIALLDPDKLFKEDGTLGEAGQFLRLKILKTISGVDNVRIDHAMGLVDPFIYDKTTLEYDEKPDDNGNPIRFAVRDKLRASYLSQSGLDPQGNYKRIIPEIVLPTLKEAGIDPENVAWEDIGGDETGLFNEVFRRQNNLPGISSIMWSRGENAPSRNWSYLGCHDDKPVRMMIDSGATKNSDAWNPDYLAGYLNPSPNRVAEREVFKQKVINDPKAALKAKFADLFRSTGKVQVSFMDFFGIDKQYNVPGTQSDENWALRVVSDYEREYHANLEKDDYVMNMPEILSIAVQAKADMDFAKGEKTEEQTKAESAPILERLNHYSDVLKEKWQWHP